MHVVFGKLHSFKFHHLVVSLSFPFVCISLEGGSDIQKKYREHRAAGESLRTARLLHHDGHWAPVFSSIVSRIMKGEVFKEQNI